VCPWHSLATAAEYLRTDCVGPILGRAYAPTALGKHISELSCTLRIPERPINDQRLPSYSKIRHGIMVRLDPASALAFSRYFNLDESATPSQPISVGLGADCHLIYAASSIAQEPLRAMPTEHWNLSIIQRELSRWLKSLRKEIPLL
jgi:hypothetical protein